MVGKSSTCWAVNFSNSPDYLIWGFGEPNPCSPFVNAIQTMNIIQILASPCNPSSSSCPASILSHDNHYITMWNSYPHFQHENLSFSEIHSCNKVNSNSKSGYKQTKNVFCFCECISNLMGTFIFEFEFTVSTHIASIRNHLVKLDMTELLLLRGLECNRGPILWTIYFLHEFGCPHAIFLVECCCLILMPPTFHIASLNRHTPKFSGVPQKLTWCQKVGLQVLQSDADFCPLKKAVFRCFLLN